MVGEVLSAPMTQLKELCAGIIYIARARVQPAPQDEVEL